MLKFLSKCCLVRLKTWLPALTIFFNSFRLTLNLKQFCMSVFMHRIKFKRGIKRRMTMKLTNLFYKKKWKLGKSSWHPIQIPNLMITYNSRILKRKSKVKIMMKKLQTRFRDQSRERALILSQMLEITHKKTKTLVLQVKLT